MGDCDICSGDDYISYTCNECGGQFCSEHRLPEAHNCPVLRRSRLTWISDEATDTADTTRKSDADADADADDKLYCYECQTETDQKCVDCGGPYCEDHVDPEAHNCAFLSAPHSNVPSDSDSGVCRECGRSTTRTCEECGGTYCKRHRSPRLHDCDARNRSSSTGRRGVPPKPSPITSGSDESGYTRYAFLIAVVVTALAVGAMAYGAPGDVLGSVESSLGSGPGNNSTATESADETQSPDSTGLDVEKVEALVHEQINAERSEHGLSALAHDPALREIASDYSERMATEDFYAHEDPEGRDFQDRYEAAGYDCRVSTGDGRYVTGAENIQQTYANIDVRTDGGTEHYDSEEDLAAGIVEGWMNSAGHRENILRSYWENEGIGVYVIENPDGPGQKVYATQNFC